MRLINFLKTVGHVSPLSKPNVLYDLLVSAGLMDDPPSKEGDHTILRYRLSHERRKSRDSDDFGDEVLQFETWRRAGRYDVFVTLRVAYWDMMAEIMLSDDGAHIQSLSLTHIPRFLFYPVLLKVLSESLDEVKNYDRSMYLRADLCCRALTTINVGDVEAKPRLIFERIDMALSDVVDIVGWFKTCDVYSSDSVRNMNAIAKSMNTAKVLIGHALKATKTEVEPAGERFNNPLQQAHLEEPGASLPVLVKATHQRLLTLLADFGDVEKEEPCLWDSLPFAKKKSEFVTKFSRFAERQSALEGLRSALVDVVEATREGASSMGIQL